MDAAGSVNTAPILSSQYFVSSASCFLGMCGVRVPSRFIRFYFLRLSSDGMPAEGIEPTRSCDHWILSPARLPVPPRRLRNKSERIRAWRRSSNASRHVEGLHTARRSENFAQNDRLTQA